MPPKRESASSSKMPDLESKLIDPKLEQELRLYIQNLSYALGHETPLGLKGIKTSLESCSNSVNGFQFLAWDSHLEELVKLLKMCVDNCTLGSFDAAFNISIEKYDLMDLSNIAVDCLLKLCTLISGSDSYNFYSALFERSPTYTSLSTVHFFGDIVTDPSFIPYGKLLNLIKTSVLAARKTLSFAQSKHTVTLPFTSFSLTAGISLRQLLNTLMSLTGDRSRNLDILQVFDTLLAVVEVVPFKRLDPACLKEVYQFVTDWVEERPQRGPGELILPIAVVILTPDVYEPISDNELFKSKISGNDLRTVLMSKAQRYLSFWCSSAEMNPSTLFFKNSAAKKHLQLLTVLAKHHFLIFKTEALMAMNLVLYILSHSTDVERDLIRCKQDMSDDLWRAQFEETMEVTTQSLILLETLTVSVSQYMAQATDPSDTFVNKFLEMWFVFFQLAPELMDSTFTSIPPGVLDCYAAVREDLFNQMAVFDRQSCFLANVLSYSRDSRPEVRAKTGRCIALMLDFLTLLQDDSYFLLDALDVIEINLNEGDLTIRSAYAWALGNLTDSLYKNYNNIVPLSAGFGFIHRVFVLASKCSTDKAKIRHNAHRTIGYLLRWMPSAELSHPGMSQLVDSSVQILLKQIGKGTDYKARWNACHALANAVQNGDLVRTFGHIMIGPILNSLSKVAVNSENFKERIQSLKGLSKLNDRILYGDHFFIVWERIFKAAVISETSRQNFIPPIDKLMEEVRVGVSSCLVHLIGLIEPGDIARLEPIVVHNCDSLLELVGKCLDTCLPDQDDKMGKAKKNVEDLRTTASSESETVIRILERAFVPKDYDEII